MENQQSDVTNPIQAASEVFYRPMAVFNKLAEANNWSWIPFIIVMLLAFFPTYLYYQVVDINWIIEQSAIASLPPDASPAEIENFKRTMPAEALQYTAFALPIGVIIIQAIIAGYYTMVTRNDEKNVQGFTDWYGATWWIAMPSVINGLIACLLLAIQDSGAQVQPSIVSPLSVAFVFGIELTSKYFNLLSGLRLDSIWSIVLAGYCITSWTSFSLQKTMIIAVIPTAIILSISFIFAAT